MTQSFKKAWSELNKETKKYYTKQVIIRANGDNADPKKVDWNELERIWNEDRNYGKSAIGSFNIGDIIEHDGEILTITEKTPRGVKFTDQNGQAYFAFDASTLRKLVDGGAWTKKSMNKGKEIKLPNCDSCGKEITDPYNETFNLEKYQK